jgi:hypothetical protein
MNQQINALKWAAQAFYQREHSTGLRMQELAAYKACVAAVKAAIPGVMWASGEWHTSIFDDSTILEVAK